MGIHDSLTHKYIVLFLFQAKFRARGGGRNGQILIKMSLSCCLQSPALTHLRLPSRENPNESNVF